jgi:molybdenum cofactor cytidylyltransferase
VEVNSADVVGIVLAAGRSSRMGRPKALLPAGGGAETFVGRLLGTLRAGGVAHVAVVGRPGDTALRAEVSAREPGPAFLVNPDPDRGQLSSLLIGVDYAESRRAAGILVVPVDIPMITPATIAAAIAAFRSSEAPIVRVTHAGQHGHPVLFRAALFAELRTADPSVGAKAVVRARAGDVLAVDVPDPGVLRDIDVPEDYRRMFGTFPA